MSQWNVGDLTERYGILKPDQCGDRARKKISEGRSRVTL